MPLISSLFIQHHQEVKGFTCPMKDLICTKTGTNVLLHLWCLWFPTSFLYCHHEIDICRFEWNVLTVGWIVWILVLTFMFPSGWIVFALVIHQLIIKCQTWLFVQYLVLWPHTYKTNDIPIRLMFCANLQILGCWHAKLRRRTSLLNISMLSHEYVCMLMLAISSEHCCAYI